MSTRELYSALRTTNSALAADLDRVIHEALEIWKRPHLNAFTEHGAAHIAQVERNLDALTRPLQASKAPLGAEEIYVLLAACYLHDIGMQLHRPDAREKHAQVAYELILHSFARVEKTDFRVTLPISDTNAREAIARVARGHWTSFALELPEEDQLYGNRRGRIRLLACLLALADLLDLSPERAGFFRSWHTLYKLDEHGELHQTKHELVRGCRIEAPNPRDAGELQFQVRWRGKDEPIPLLSDWVLHQCTAEWRRLAPVLRLESGGAIRWADPWALALLDETIGPSPVLSPGAMAELARQRAEQQRINRDAFVAAFYEALRTGSKTLFRVPSDARQDGSHMSRWCRAAARAHGVRAIELSLRPSAAQDLVSAAAIILAQLGESLPGCGPEEALDRLRRALSRPDCGPVVYVVVAASGLSKDFVPLLEAMLAHAPDAPAARVAVLLTPDQDELQQISGAHLDRPEWAALGEEEIRRHLSESWGLSASQLEEGVGTALSLGLEREPGKLYTFVERSFAKWQTQELHG